MVDLDEYMQEDVAKLQVRDVGQYINDFCEVNYNTALSVNAETKPTPEDIALLRSKIVDIIRSNPPLASIPRYFQDGREDYLWYSDFYDDIPKDIYHTYRTFVKPTNKITPANYAEELAKIDLPYFRELVDLVSLERLCIEYEKKLPKETKPIIEEQPRVEEVEHEPVVKKTKPKVAKRSYQPKLSNEQYKLLTDCIETIKLFRSKIKVSELKKLLSGKLAEPFQVANQKSLVYLLDQLSEYEYIKKEWIAVADNNKDFISFRTEGNKERYGDNTHYINMQQLLNCRNRNRKESIYGLENIEDLIDELNKLNFE